MNIYFIVAIYLLPSFIAFIFDKKHWLAILVFNLLLGWFMWGLFWVFALVWAIADNKRS